MVYRDSSSFAYAGYERTTLNGTAYGTWSKEEAIKSSTWRELCAVLNCLKSLRHILASNRVKWFTDNSGVSSIVSKGSMKPDLQNLAMEIFNFTLENSIHLEVEWIPREENARADYLSKVVERDDWGIGDKIFDMIKDRLGIPDIDYFASDHNAKLPLFYSRFWSPKAAGVDAFTYDWGKNFGLFVPPIILISRVLRKMERCHAKGILVVPEWKSSNFWPLICLGKGELKNFIKDWILLPTNKESYYPCKNGVGIFGTEDLKFRMLALAMDFSQE